jgi:hypothetical protein
MAKKRKARVSDHSNIRFMGARSLAYAFGEPGKSAFDSERELIAYVLKFINGDESPAEPDPAQASAQPMLQAEALASMRQDWRAFLRRFVSTFRSSRSAALRLVPEHLLTLHNISIMPKWEPAGAHLDFWVPINSPDALRALFVLMLADDSRPFGGALCRCRLDGCGRFFLEQKPATGRPQRLYCSRKHMLAAHAARER